MSAYDSDIAAVAALMADRARAAMLTALLDGRPLAAGELARVAGVTAQTASAHLAKLREGGLVAVVKQGRHRYFRLRGEEVAQVIEALSRISPPVEVRSLRQSRQAAALRAARTCYDHLAGQAGTALFAALLDGGLLEAAGEESYEVTAKGEERLHDLAIDLAVLREARRRFAGHCLDWTERRPHLNGALGAALTERMIERGWFVRGRTRRALVLTDRGRAGLQDSFGCVVP
ncbi:MAG TPA: helix-turn-helix domain-containing protein [Streptosporangiaceae bacterium]|nr:helix-turn-helix domain-containing protein [Streptosporangiaceae bacterium]